MAIIKCKMCGGDLILEEGSNVAECEYCGSRQTVPSADNEKKLNLFARANRLRASNEFDKAAGVYESIVADFPEEAEAYWGLILCKYGIEYVDDPGTGKKIPTCHRSSFDSVMDDPNFELVMENADPIARRVYREEAKQLEELRKGIIEASSKEEPYDIFICYKETAEDGQRTLDSVLAQDVYDMLIENGYRVFFSRVSLEDKLGVEYEPYIFAALNSAKIMLAFGTDYDYFNAVWVKNEWSRFLQLIAKGEKKTLIPCYKGIDAYDMPKEFAKLQAQDLGKVGANQDLLRGIKKILPKGDEKAASASQPVIQQVVSGSPNVAPLLRRAFMYLEDGEWQNADEYCEKVLDQEPKNAEAYLGKLMAELHLRQRSSLSTCDQFYFENRNYKKALRFGNAELKNELKELEEKLNQRSESSAAKQLKFSETENGYAVSELQDKDWSKILRIPKRFKGKPVTAIEEGAFCECESLTSVIIPDSVTSIERHAFLACGSLASITIPNSVTRIGEEAFFQCESLTSITIPDSVTSIGAGAFSCCPKLKAIHVSDNQAAFCSVDGVLTNKAKTELIAYPGRKTNNYTIPNSITSIGDSAFSYCENLTSITIPNSVISIGKEAFSNCKSLTSITIPNSVISIGKEAFSNCKSLTSITIPDSVTSIGESAFGWCESLTSITIPKGVTSIGKSAFWACNSLTRITIPNSVISIGESAFHGCGNLTNITIPNSVTSIGKSAFGACNSLTKITIPNSVISIGESAFEECNRLTDITIPDSVISIGAGAFSCCPHLEAIHVGDNHSAYCSVAGFLTNKAKTELIAYSDQKTKYYTIPNSVVSIRDCAFKGCKSLTGITIPESVTSIGESAFHGCGNMTSITIPNSVTSISKSAFECCKSLTSITIPDGVTIIGENAFKWCKNLTMVTLPDSVSSIGEHAFEGCSSLKTILCTGDYKKLKSVFEIEHLDTPTILGCLAQGKKVTAVAAVIMACNKITTEPTVEVKLAESKARIESMTVLRSRLDGLLAQAAQLKQEQSVVATQEANLTAQRAKLRLFSGKEKKRIDESLSVLAAKKRELDNWYRQNVQMRCDFNSVTEIDREIAKERSTASRLEAQIAGRRVSEELTYSYEEAVKAYQSEPVVASIVNTIVPEASLFLALQGKTDLLLFGKYVQKENGAPEPIEWQVLKRENNRILVISKYVLERMAYNWGGGEVSWETCSLRKWLNGEFLNRAFSNKDRAMICNATVIAHENLECRTTSRPGNNTKDQVFLLSIPEREKYTSRDECKCTPKVSALLRYGSSCVWWLRSPGVTNFRAATCGGYSDNYGKEVKESLGVRPSMWISL